MRKKFKIENLPCPQKNSDAVCKSVENSGLNDPRLKRNTAHVDLSDENLDNVRFIKLNSLPAIGEHLTAKCYVDQSVQEPTLVRNNEDNNVKNHNLFNIKRITLNTQAVNDNQVITKAYVDQFHQENEQSIRDLGSNFYDEWRVLAKKIKTMISMIRNWLI